MFGGFNEVAAHRRLHMTGLKNTEFVKYVEARKKQMYRSASQQQSN